MINELNLTSSNTKKLALCEGSQRVLNTPNVRDSKRREKVFFKKKGRPSPRDLPILAPWLTHPTWMYYVFRPEETRFGVRCSLWRCCLCSTALS
jgi:hypothetical protein